jgi:hypothetical protein
MAEATLTTVIAALKEVYGPRIEDQYVDELTALKRIERTSDGVVETAGGKYVDFPIRVQRNTGVFNRKENEQLGAAGKQGYAEVHVPLYYAYARVRFTGQVMELADGNPRAFANMMDEEMDGVKNDRLDDDARQVYGDGTGLLATITDDDSPGDNTLTVDTVQYLEEGERIDILTIADGTVKATNRLITSIVGLVITYDGADVDPTTADGLYRQGNYISQDQREITGFGRIISATSILHGVNPSTTKRWAATVNANGGTPRPLSEGLMIKTMDDVRTAGGGRPSVVFGGLGVRRAYFNLLSQQRRITDTKKFAGGFEGLVFNYGKEVPMVEDPKCGPQKMLFVSEDKVKVYRNKPYHWADADGNILKWVTDYDAWEALLKQYWELGTSQRNAHAALTDLIEG